jgi:glycosyltransferase involved in cell wall biosynthesis
MIYAMKKISICTVNMNRLEHLSQTLPRNIMDNVDYPKVEFVVLNYNSRDGMDEWMMTRMKQYIKSGILKYYKTDEPQYFQRSHSKNTALKLATGDILCMVDADNYAGPGYAKWINSTFADNGPDTIITTIRKDSIPYRDQGGKLCFSRELLYTVNGFDETLIDYGVEDIDLVNRLEKAGGKRVFIKDKKYLEFIGHSLDDRLKNHHLSNNVEDVYMLPPATEAGELKVIYLLKDGSFLAASFEFDKEKQKELIISFKGWSMIKDSHRKGIFERQAQGILLKSDGPDVFCSKEQAGALRTAGGGEEAGWKEVEMNSELSRFLIVGYSECLNRLIYLENDKKHYAINENGWGRGATYLVS